MASLHGIRVVLTRPEDASTEILDVLRDAGADATNIPLIAIGPPSDGGEALRTALVDPLVYEWILVTSANGARALRDAVADDQRLPKLAVVGSATGAALGRAVSFTPSRATARCLADEFDAGTGRVLVVRAEEPSVDLAALLQPKGWIVDVVAGYATTAELLDQQDRRQVMSADVVVFASGSAARSFAQQRLSGPNTTFVALGESTKSVMDELGLRVSAVASSPAGHDVVVAVGEAMGRTSP
ncbi:MAG: uroporphyrinogen-III synthase [Actinobacteria bacterium]|nr:uroporphyrinogen-III synthase [Actinomycetota bacterium]